MDIHVMVMLMPIGLVFCFRPFTDATLFLVLYGITAVYFSGVMVRLMLVLAPAACCLAALAVNEVLRACCAGLVASGGPDGASRSSSSASLAGCAPPCFPVLSL